MLSPNSWFILFLVLYILFILPKPPEFYLALYGIAFFATIFYVVRRFRS